MRLAVSLSLLFCFMLVLDQTYRPCNAGKKKKIIKKLKEILPLLVLAKPKKKFILIPMPMPMKMGGKGGGGGGMDKLQQVSRSNFASQASSS